MHQLDEDMFFISLSLDSLCFCVSSKCLRGKLFFFESAITEICS